MPTSFLKNKKLFVIIICIIAFLAISAACFLWRMGGYSLDFSKQNPVLKDYSNLFYRFKYPDSFEINNERVYTEHKLNGVGKDIYGLTLVILFKPPIYSINIESTPNWGDFTIDEFLKNELNNFSSWKYNKEIIVNGKRAVRHCKDMLCFNGEIIVIPTQNYFYEIIVTWGGEQKRKEIENFIDSFTILID